MEREESVPCLLMASLCPHPHPIGQNAAIWPLHTARKAAIGGLHFVPIYISGIVRVNFMCQLDRLRDAP